MNQNGRAKKRNIRLAMKKQSYIRCKHCDQRIEYKRGVMASWWQHIRDDGSVSELCFDFEAEPPEGYDGQVRVTISKIDYLWWIETYKSKGMYSPDELDDHMERLFEAMEQAEFLDAKSSSNEAPTLPDPETICECGHQAKDHHEAHYSNGVVDFEECEHYGSGEHGGMIPVGSPDNWEEHCFYFREAK